MKVEDNILPTIIKKLNVWRYGRKRIAAILMDRQKYKAHTLDFLFNILKSKWRKLQIKFDLVYDLEFAVDVVLQ